MLRRVAQSSMKNDHTYLTQIHEFLLSFYFWTIPDSSWVLLPAMCISVVLWGDQGDLRCWELKLGLSHEKRVQPVALCLWSRFMNFYYLPPQKESSCFWVFVYVIVVTDILFQSLENKLYIIMFLYFSIYFQNTIYFYTTVNGDHIQKINIDKVINLIDGPYLNFVSYSSKFNFLQLRVSHWISL